MENNSRGNARDDESEGENQRGRRRTQSKHEWDDVHECGSGHQPQMTDDDSSDSQALTGGDVTRYRALVARISYLSQDRPDLKFASMQVCCAMAKPALRDMERVKRIGEYLGGNPRARCWFRWQQGGELDEKEVSKGSPTAARCFFLVAGSLCSGVVLERERTEGLAASGMEGVKETDLLLFLKDQLTEILE